VVFAIHRPHQATAVAVDAERAVRSEPRVAGGRIQEQAGVTGRTIADAKRRLVMEGIRPLPHPQVFVGGRVAGDAVGRGEAVGVAVDDHGGLVRDWVSAGQRRSRYASGGVAEGTAWATS
jgi:hypothetical protein